MPDQNVQVSAELPREMLDTLERLAKERGVSANTVLQQAITTERFLADTIGSGKKVLIENNDHSLEQVFLDSFRKASANKR